MLLLMSQYTFLSYGQYSIKHFYFIKKKNLWLITLYVGSNPGFAALQTHYGAEPDYILHTPSFLIRIHNQVTLKMA